MKLTNDQIFVLGAAGFGRLNYGKLEPEHALNAYKLRKEIMQRFRELEDAKREIIQDVWDEEALAKALEYEKSKTGMTESEYKAVMGEYNPKVMEMLASLGREEKDIPVQPIPFAAWLLLLRDNAFLAGYEELLADFIAV